MSDTAVNMSVETLKRVDLVTVSGRIDSSNAAEFEGNLKELMNSGRHSLVLNLAHDKSIWLFFSLLLANARIRAAEKLAAQTTALVLSQPRTSTKRPLLLATAKQA